MAGTQGDTIESKLAEAKLAEHTERYDDMAVAMKFVVESSKSDLECSTRNLLSVAYKNVVGTKRSAWRLLSSIEAKDAKDEQKKLTKEYKDKIENDLRDVCNQVLVSCNYLIHVRIGNVRITLSHLRSKKIECTSHQGGVTPILAGLQSVTAVKVKKLSSTLDIY